MKRQMIEQTVTTRQPHVVYGGEQSMQTGASALAGWRHLETIPT